MIYNELRRFLKVLSAVVLLSAGSAVVDDYKMFHSPSGNINCAIFSDASGTSARCDILEFTPSFTTPPADCEFDWGSSFAVDAVGPGYLACVSDAVSDPGSPVLPYGQSVSVGGITCQSAETGLTCTNSEGHGFSLRKAEQTVF